MTPIDSLAISVPVLISIFGLVIAWQNYKLNKKKSYKADTKLDVDKAKEDEERQKQNEIRLVAIEKDVQYIRLIVDKVDSKIDEHDKRITNLEVHYKNQKK